jgi:polyisoprenoid-binding protein YceI
MNSVFPHRYSALVRALLCFLLPALATGLSAQQIHLRLNAQQSEVHWVLKDTLQTVHGSFAIKQGHFTFYPEEGTDWCRAEGEVVIDVPSGASGNKTRDARMHREFLESYKYPVAIFRARRYSGIIRPGPLQTVRVEGTITLHGVEHPLTLEFKVLLDGNKVAAETGFEIPYVDWGIKDPSIPMIHVEKQALVEVAARGVIEFIPAK